jgi:type VI secretion system protein ImpM
MVAGLFGKLPAHGDFVRRGWTDATVDAIDRWLTDAVALAREGRDEDAFADWMRAGPLWRGYVPAGALGPDALHLAVAPSVDRAGRLFPLAAGMAGEGAWAHATSQGAALDGAVYAAIAGGADADATVAAIDGTSAASGEAPARSAWWRAAEGAPEVESEAVDAALLVRLMSGDPA